MPVTSHAGEIWEGLTMLAMECDNSTQSDDLPRACVVLILNESGALELHQFGDVDGYRAAGMMDGGMKMKRAELREL